MLSLTKSSNLQFVKAQAMGLSRWRCFISAMAISAVFCGFEAKAVDAPTITASSKGFDCPRTITMEAKSGTITWDTTNGFNFDHTYTVPFKVFSSVLLTAKATVGGVDSAATKLSLYLDPSVPEPSFWLKPGSEYVTRGGGNPQPVAVWSDVSGKGNNAIYGSGGRAFFRDTLNGQTATIDFLGTSSLSFPSGFADFTSTGLSIFLVTRPEALNDGARILDLGTGSSTFDNILIRTSKSGSDYYAELGVYDSKASGSFVASSNKLVQGQYQIIEGIISTSGSTTGTVYLNGVKTGPSSMTTPTNINRTKNYLGQSSASGNSYTGAIAEAVLFPSVLSESQRQAFESFLFRKYQISTQAPAAPLFSVAGGAKNAPFSLSLCSPAGASIRWTTGSIGSPPPDPDEYSPLFEGPIAINYSQIVKARTISNGIKSSVVSSTYTLNSTQFPAPSGSDPAPTINPLTLPTPSQ